MIQMKKYKLLAYNIILIKIKQYLNDMNFDNIINWKLHLKFDFFKNKNNLNNNVILNLFKI